MIEQNVSKASNEVNQRLLTNIEHIDQPCLSSSQLSVVPNGLNVIKTKMAVKDCQVHSWNCQADAESSHERIDQDDQMQSKSENDQVSEQQRKATAPFLGKTYIKLINFNGVLRMIYRVGK